MPLPHAEPPHSVDWKTWLIRQFLYDERPAQQYTTFSSFISGLVKQTYEPDGYDSSYDEQVAAPDIQDAGQYNPRLTQFFARFITFIGLPDRRTRFEYQATSDNLLKGDFYYGLTPTQFAKNLIGGWDSRPDISTEKKIWQFISLFIIKIPLILPLNLLIFPFKFILNLVKPFTEIIPLFISQLLALSVDWALNTLQSEQRNLPLKRSFDDFEKIETTPDPVFTECKYTADDVIPHHELNKSSLFSIATIALLLSIVVLGIANAAGRILAFIGRALTSPAKNLRMSFAAGKEIEWKTLGIILGLIGAGLSITTTLALWFIALPFSISAIISYVPIIAQTIASLLEVPFIASVLTTLSQMPFVIASMSAMGSAISSLGIALSTTFGPALLTLATLVGLQLTEGLIVICSAITFIASLSSVTLSLITKLTGEILIRWKNGGPISFIIGLKMASSPKEDSTLLLGKEVKAVNPQSLEPTQEAQSVTEGLKINEDVISKGIDTANKLQKSLEEEMNSEKGSAPNPLTSVQPVPVTTTMPKDPDSHNLGL